MSTLRFVVCACVGLCGLLGGCNDPAWTFDQSSKHASKSDIYKVVCFYPPNMWRSFDEAGDRNIEGFTFILYLISSTTERGALADGTIDVQIFTVDTVDGVQTSRVLAHEWSSSTSDLPQRNPTKLGHGYQPSIDWQTLDLFNRDIEILVRYVAPDGSVTPSRTASMKVPPRKL
ncbi:MAG: hypothetical protein DHS20C16_18000 [Phycisphaerae bacterium]|nr:MAG: hypothetical protein DHS20C16_18000 [Phycisphaerae bacterium]